MTMKFVWIGTVERKSKTSNKNSFFEKEIFVKQRALNNVSSSSQKVV